MAQGFEAKCPSCNRQLSYIRLDGIGRCHICGMIAKEEIDKQKNAWREQQILSQKPQITK